MSYVKLASVYEGEASAKLSREGLAGWHAEFDLVDLERKLCMARLTRPSGNAPHSNHRSDVRTVPWNFIILAPRDEVDFQNELAELMAPKEDQNADSQPDADEVGQTQPTPTPDETVATPAIAAALIATTEPLKLPASTTAGMSTASSKRRKKTAENSVVPPRPPSQRRRLHTL